MMDTDKFKWSSLYDEEDKAMSAKAVSIRKEEARKKLIAELDDYKSKEATYAGAWAAWKEPPSYEFNLPLGDLYAGLQFHLHRTSIPFVEYSSSGSGFRSDWKLSVHKGREVMATYEWVTKSVSLPSSLDDRLFSLGMGYCIGKVISEIGNQYPENYATYYPSMLISFINDKLKESVKASPPSFVTGSLDKWILEGPSADKTVWTTGAAPTISTGTSGYLSADLTRTVTYDARRASSFPTATSTITAASGATISSTATSSSGETTITGNSD